MWKDIPGYEGLYQASDCNEGILSLNYNHTGLKKILASAIDHKGYYRNSLFGTDKKCKYLLVSRLVAITFIDNPNNYPIVMHLDNNPLNNHVDNLKWGTQHDNVLHCWSQGRAHNQFMYNNPNPNKGKFGKDNHLSIPVIKYSMDLKFISEYGSLKEAERETNINISTIIKTCKGKQKTAGGFIWKYKSDTFSSIF